MINDRKGSVDLNRLFDHSSLDDLYCSVFILVYDLEYFLGKLFIGANFKINSRMYKPARASEEQSDTQILPTIADRSQERGGESSQPAFEM